VGAATYQPRAAEGTDCLGTSNRQGAVSVQLSRSLALNCSGSFLNGVELDRLPADGRVLAQEPRRHRRREREGREAENCALPRRPKLARPASQALSRADPWTEPGQLAPRPLSVAG